MPHTKDKQGNQPLLPKQGDHNAKGSTKRNNDQDKTHKNPQRVATRTAKKQRTPEPPP